MGRDESGEEGMLMSGGEGRDVRDESDSEVEAVEQMGNKSIRPNLWMGLSVVSTIAGRRVLRCTFPYPFYYVFLIQLVAYVVVAITVVVLRVRSFRRGKRKGEEESYLVWERAVVATRMLLSSYILGFAALCGVKALMLYSSLPVIAMLPILTYSFDCLFFRAAYVLRLLPRDKQTTGWLFARAALVVAAACGTLVEDYRLDIKALAWAVAGIVLSSLSKLISKMGPKIEPKGVQGWERSFELYLLAGILPLVIAGFFTSKFENVVAASHTFRSWGPASLLLNLGPAAVLQGLFSSSLNSAFPFISEEHVGGALEEETDVAKEAVATTLQSGFWIIVFGTLGKEENFLDWFQVISFTLIYIICVGPKHIGYYPPRILNFTARIFRRRQLPMQKEPWQLPFFLVTTTLVFGILVSANIMYWVDTVAYHRNLKAWLGPPSSLDTAYRPPQVRSFDVVIAHSADHPLESITSLISDFAMYPSISGLAPNVIVYSKNSTVTNTDETKDSIKGSYDREITIQTLHNTGGPTASYLYHILASWDALPVQTLFISTLIPSSSIQGIHNRLHDYFVPMGFPLPDALPKTGFLNLGEMETCWCGDCKDSLGWEDTFHLVPSMWGAARLGTTKCESVLLTHGNNFIASAARIRGLKKDVWQLLYDALVKEDVENAWAHKADKLPKKLEGEKDLGRWDPDGGVFGTKDSVEKPVLGATVERLWGVLLQCSNARVAWACPNLFRGWRMRGVREDCGCVDEIV